MKRWIAYAAYLLLPQIALAQSGAKEHLPQDDPAKNAEIIELLTKYKRAKALERLPALSTAQKERVIGYYTRGTARKDQEPRGIAMGLSALINGFGEIGEVQAYVKTYHQTGKLPEKGMPMPNSSFQTAADKFQGAAEYLADLLETTKKLDEQVGAVVNLAIQQNEKRSADADKRSADAQKRIDLLDALLKAMK